MRITRILRYKPAYNFLRRDYWFGEVDARPLSMFRILLGMLLLKVAIYDLFILDSFFSDTGVMPRSLLDAPQGFALMSPLATGTAAGLFILLWIIVICCLIMGYRTTMVSILNFILLASVIQRRDIISDGADSVMLVSSFWLMFIAANKHYSMDALRLRWRRFQASHYLADLRAPVESERIFALPVRMIQLQVALIYLMTFLQKLPGEEWQNGTALHYVLQQESFGLFTGHWLLATFPPEVFVFLTYFTLFMEASFILLVFLPWFQPWLRLSGLFMGILLHLGIAITMSIPNFSLAMLIAYTPFLCMPEFTGWLRTLWENQPTLFIALPSSQHRIRWVLLALSSPRLLDIHERPEETITLDDTTPVRHLLSALPGKQVWLALFRLPGVHAVVFFLLKHYPAPDFSVRRQVRTKSEIPGQQWQQLSRLLRSITLIPLMLLLLAWSISSIHYNWSGQGSIIKHRVDVTLPGIFENVLISDILAYTQLADGWAMFAPRPGLIDVWAIVDGEFSDGTYRNLLVESTPPTTADRYWWYGPFSRWKLYIRSMWFFKEDNYLPAWANYYCHRYNTLHAANITRLQTVDITLISRWAYQPGREKPFRPMYDAFSFRCDTLNQ